MAEGQINWKQTDYLSLGKAVATFNRTIKKLQTEENKNYLPEEVNYRELKENIYTRKELNRVINSLREFREEGQSDLYENDAGQQMTVWEKNQVQRNIEIGIKRLNRELRKWENNPEYPQETDEEVVLKHRIKNLKKFQSSKGYDFDILKERAFNIGRDDYKMKQAIIYRENYMKVLERYQDFDNYEKLVNYLNRFKNPIRFYERMKKTNNDNTLDLTYVSDEHYSQTAFNSFVAQFIDINELEDSE